MKKGVLRLKRNEKLDRVCNLINAYIEDHYNVRNYVGYNEVKHNFDLENKKSIFEIVEIIDYLMPPCNLDNNIETEKSMILLINNIFNILNDVDPRDQLSILVPVNIDKIHYHNDFSCKVTGTIDPNIIKSGYCDAGCNESKIGNTASTSPIINGYYGDMFKNNNSDKEPCNLLDSNVELLDPSVIKNGNLIIQGDVQETLASGAKQNKVDYTYANLFTDSMLLGAAKTRAEGVAKYGQYNHLRIDPRENIDRAINHLISYLNKETREDEEHLAHAVVRIGMAMDFIKNFGYKSYWDVKEQVEEFITKDSHKL